MKARVGLEGVDVPDDAGTGLRAAVRRKLASARLWLVDPAAWSARRYRDKNSMELEALHPERWRRGDR